ncbi:insulinase family protein [Kitasatospora acidiphila]|uniref:Insulinase family protein n=1 Tax=Kitasatospora acidiphila TaxID=2567942 RepID=A0A540W4S3_9ACTN|nr:pitrilysin family protein [Kitasatospora acidiphila]TQF04045.1 insulinase family protein [Kitasatospora acidiphila]
MAQAFGWQIAEHRLDNGLRVTVSRDARGPVAAVNLWYDVGSRDDPADGHGFAHLLEHLMFEGSAQVGRGQHSAMLAAVGGAEVNATTSMDRTNYFQTVPTSALDLALWLEADRMGGLALSPEVFDNQRAVVRNERAQQYESQPYGLWLEFGLPLVFPGDHPYRRPSMGSPDQLDRAGLAALDAFRRTHYSPGNAVLTVVGDVEPEAVFDAADRYFSGIPAAEREVERELPGHVPVESRPLPGRSVRMVVDRKASAERVFVMHRIPPAHTADHDALTVLAAVLGRGRGSRFHRELMANQELARAEEKTAFAWELARGSSLFATGMTVHRGVPVAELLAAQEVLLDELAATAVRDEELERAKAVLAAGWLRSLTPFGARADLLARYAVQLGEAAAIRERQARIAAVSAADLQRVAVRHLRPENRVVLILRPDPGA